MEHSGLLSKPKYRILDLTTAAAATSGSRSSGSGEEDNQDITHRQDYDKLQVALQRIRNFRKYHDSTMT